MTADDPSRMRFIDSIWMDLDTADAPIAVDVAADIGNARAVILVRVAGETVPIVTELPAVRSLHGAFSWELFASRGLPAASWGSLRSDEHVIERDGVERRLVTGMFGIFGHGNVTSLAVELHAVQDRLPTWRGQNEQGMALAAVGFAKATRRRQIMVAASSIGPRGCSTRRWRTDGSTPPPATSSAARPCCLAVTPSRPRR